MMEYSVAVGEKIGRTPEDVLESLKGHNNRLFSTMYVMPERWMEASKGVSRDLTGEEHYLNSESDILMSLYQRSPKLFPGVKSLLTYLSNEGFKLCTVSHAPFDWADKRLIDSGLGGVLDAMVLAKVDQPKTDEVWERGLIEVDLTAEQVFGAGDSKLGDGWPMYRKRFWGIILLPTVWHVTHAEMPARAVPISRYGEFFVGVRQALGRSIS